MGNIANEQIAARNGGLQSIGRRLRVGDIRLPAIMGRLHPIGA